MITPDDVPVTHHTDRILPPDAAMTDGGRPILYWAISDPASEVEAIIAFGDRISRRTLVDVYVMASQKPITLDPDDESIIFARQLSAWVVSGPDHRLCDAESLSTDELQDAFVFPSSILYIT